MSFTRVALAALMAGGACGIPAAAHAQEADFPKRIKQTDEYEIHQVGRRSYAVMLRSGMYRKMGSNAGFVVTSRGVVVFDAQISEAAAKLIIDEIRAITPQPIKFVVNSHAHDDHALGNSAHPASTAIIAHREAVKALRQAGKTRIPNQAVDRDKTLFEGDDRVEVLCVGNAHSAGDLALYDPQDKVMFLGDMYVRGFVGYLAEGFLRDWVAALDRLLAREIRFAIPGHGMLGGPEPVREYRDYLRDFMRSAREHFQKHKSVEGYELPEKYAHLGSRNYIPGNVKRAFELWKLGQLDDAPARR